MGIDMLKIKGRVPTRQAAAHHHPYTHHLTAEPYTAPAPDISAAPKLMEVQHVLQAEPLTIGPPDIGRKPPPPPGVHHLKAAPPTRPRKRSSPSIELIQTVLRKQIPEWRERFPTVAEMSNDKLQAKGKKALEKDPRTHDWKWTRVRKSFMRAVGREKLK